MIAEFKKIEHDTSFLGKFPKSFITPYIYDNYH